MPEIKNSKEKNKGIFDFYIVMKSGVVKTFNTDDSVRQPIGRDFHSFITEFDYSVMPIKCKKCKSINLAYFYEPEPGGSDERGMGVESIFYLTTDQECESCKENLHIEIGVSTYVDQLLCSIDEVDACEPASIYGLTDFLETQSKILEKFMDKDD